jgi:hypothetical protein
MNPAKSHLWQRPVGAGIFAEIKIIFGGASVLAVVTALCERRSLRPSAVTDRRYSCTRWPSARSLIRFGFGSTKRPRRRRWKMSVATDNLDNPILEQFSEDGFVDCVFKISDLVESPDFLNFHLSASSNGEIVGMDIVVRKKASSAKSMGRFFWLGEPS